MSAETLENRLQAVEPLAEPVRRALYLHVASQPAAVSRDEAAAAAKISRELAAFHLDKLVGAGLLVAVYRRLGGRSGPGAGRPSKLYQRSARQVDITLPQREYELAARIFAGALGLGEGSGRDQRLDAAAAGQGRTVGREIKRGAGSRASQARLQVDLLDRLAGLGYEPYLAPDRSVRLANCPYHALAQEFRDQVCGMNLAFLEGVCEGAGVKVLRAKMESVEGSCCVSFTDRRTQS